MKKFFKKAAGVVKKAVKGVGSAAKKVVKSPGAKILATAGAGSLIGGKIAGPVGKVTGAGLGAIAGRKMFGRKKSSGAASSQEDSGDPIRNLMQGPVGFRPFKKGGPVKRAAGSSPKGEEMAEKIGRAIPGTPGSGLGKGLESFGKRARSGQLGSGQKKSDLPLVDQYEVDRKMGRFSGSFKEYMESKGAKQFKHGGVAHSDNTGRAMKKTDADAKGRAMPKAPKKMMGGGMAKYAKGASVACGPATRGYGAARKSK